MAKIKVTLEVDVPDVEVSYQELNQFVWFYICQEGSIGPDNPLYDADYEIIEFDAEAV